MFSRNTDSSQQYHNGYHGHPHKRWSDSQQIRPDFIGLAPPPHQIRSVNRESFHPLQGATTLERNQPLENIRQSNHGQLHPSYYGSIRLPSTSSYTINVGLMGPPPRQQSRLDNHGIESVPRFQSDTVPITSIASFHSPPSVRTNSLFPGQSQESYGVSKNCDKMRTPDCKRVLSPSGKVTLSDENYPKPLQEIDSNIPRRRSTQDAKGIEKLDANSSSPHGKSATTTSTNPELKARFQLMSPISMCFSRMLGAAEMIKTPAGKKVKTSDVHDCSLTSESTLSRGVVKTESTEVKRTPSELLSLDDSNPFDELSSDDELERLVVLQMAMQRHQIFGLTGFDDDGTREESDDLSPSRPVSNIISEGFFWREYQACEQVLYKHMERYYEVSAIQRNYKVQQSFNNVLVKEVRAAAETAGFSFEASFDDKKLRDRIRCFYKTHLQNAKKRLATLQKHPESMENRCLVAVYIRCVRDRTLTFQESLAMAPEFPKKRRRMDKVEKLKYDLAASDSNFASRYSKNKRDRLSCTSSSSDRTVDSFEYKNDVVESDK